MKRIQASAAPLRAALSALLLGACLVQVSPALGQANSTPPERMTYQGFLVGSDGVALGNTNPRNYDVVFRIFDAENAGNLLWAEQQTVTVDKGFFNVLLGEGAAVGTRPALSSLFKGATASDRFVGITVNGIGVGGANVDILPRLRLMTSPYAFLAQNAVKLVQNNAGGADLLTSADNVLTFNGHLDVLGNNSLEFGVGLTKQSDAGRIGYQLFGSPADSLDIVGAGTGNNRKVRIYAEGGLNVTGPITAPSITATLFGDGSGITGVAKLGANTFTGYQEVQNHLRVGELTSSVNSTGWGEALIFSGAPRPTLGLDSDNSDPLWLARFNSGNNTSELRMVIGDDPGSSGDGFVIGTMVGSGNFSQSATWAPQVTIDARGFMGLNGRSADYPLTFPNTLGDKISLWGNAGAAHYGFGVQNSTLQIHGDGSSSRIAFGYGSSGSFTYTGLINYDAMYIYHPTTPQLNLQRTSSGTYANVYHEGTRIIIGMTGSAHGGNGSYRYASYDGDSNWDFNSDRKLKKDITDATPVLERALKVQVRTFRWKGGPTEGPKMIGVIAQELQPLFPDMVSETENPETREKNLSVGYGDFAVIAIKAIQEIKAQQDAEVKDLKAQVADLKAQMKEVLQAAAELRGQAEKSKVTASVSK
jgi:hypothetical protein